MIWRKETPPAQVENRPRGFDDYELRLGDLLRGERATLGKSLLDVQRELHIRATYIAAIENGDLSVFETPSFVAGFVRSYARYLGMDPEWVYERFCKEHDFAVVHGMTPASASGAQARPTQAPAPAGGAALRGVGLLPDPDPWWKRVEPGALGSVTLLVTLIAALGYAGWTILKEVQRVQVAPADVVPTVISDIDPLRIRDQAPGAGLSAAADLPVPGASAGDPLAGVASGRVRIARPEALETPVLVPRDGPIAAIPAQQGPRSGTGTGAATGLDIDAAVAAALSVDSPDNAAPRVVQDAPTQVQLLAVRPAWVRVRAADGSVILERILNAGESYTLPATESPPTLHAGNSGSVYFLIGDQAYGPAAPGATVVRDLALSAATLRERYSVADLNRDADLAVHVARLREN